MATAANAVQFIGTGYAMNMLVSAANLAAHLDDAEWVIFDCRHDLMDLGKGERLYLDGHIAGAHFAHLDIDLSGEKSGTNGRHPLPSPAAFGAFLARHGVTALSKIVAYDDAGGPYAARLWWLARWIGLRDVALLDGGLSAWSAAELPISRAVPVLSSAALRTQANPLMVWSAAEVLSMCSSCATLGLHAL